MRRLEVRFAEHLRSQGWLSGGRPVVVAASGGVDSTTLLHLLAFGSLRPSALHAVHVDHRMHPGSAREAARVAAACAEWGVACRLHRAREPVRTEAEGRALRHEAFRAERRRLGAGALVMTAHTADDQAETVLFRAARGSGPRGLGGIRALHGAEGVARPLLPFRRAEIDAYARAHELPFREDPTNRDERWTRNRIRLSILPRLEEAVPGARAALAALAGTCELHAAALDELLDDLMDRAGVRTEDRPALRSTSEQSPPRADDPAAPSPRAIDLDRSVLRDLSRPVLTLLLRRALERVGGSPGRRTADALVRLVRSSEGGSRVEVAGAVAEARSGAIRIRGVRG